MEFYTSKELEEYKVKFERIKKKPFILKNSGLYNMSGKCLLEFKYPGDVPYKILKYMRKGDER